jgi:hypothetical protein
MGQESLLMDFYGVYKGMATQTADPEGLGRLKAQVPQVLGNEETDWAWPAQPNIAGVPALQPGAPVWILFEGGDPHHPVWLGTWAKVGGALPPLPDVTANTASITALQVALAALQQQVDDNAVVHWMTRVTS